MVKSRPLPSCPMAETCKGMMEKPFSGLVPIIAGILFIALGVLIVIEPRILVWALAVVFVLFGIMMLMMGGFIRKMTARFQNMHKQAM